MDMNVQRPLEWTSVGGPYEIASYCIAEKSNILILLNAWLESPEDIGEDTAWSTVNFWAHRLRPLWEPREGESSDNRRETNVVICNRTGKENGEFHVPCSCGGARLSQYLGRKFCGSSCSFQMRVSLGKPRLTHAMGKDEEGISLWTI
jgi:protein N-terminal amidase